MIKRLLTTVVALWAITILSCAQSLPKNAKLSSNGRYYKIYTSVVKQGEEGDLSSESVWLYDKSTKQTTKLFTTTDKADPNYYNENYRAGNTIEGSVDVVEIPDEKGKLLVSGTANFHTADNFIYDITTGVALYLKSGGSYVGTVCEDETYIILQEHSYYEEGGRYAIIQAFDMKGNKVNQMELKR